MLRSNTHNNILLQSDWNEYGEQSFSFTIAYEFSNLQQCMDKEMELVNSLDNLYNIVKDSSKGGDIFTNNPRKEEIRKMRIKQMSGKANHQYGKPKTEKMINSVKEANSKKIIIEGKIYDSLTSASKELGIGITTVSYRLNSKTFENWNYLNK